MKIYTKKMRRFLYATLLASTLIAGVGASAKAHATNTSEQSRSATPTEWRIVPDKKDTRKEFEFIQKDLESNDSADDGHFLLIAGVSLVAIAAVGVTFFSIKLYKLSRRNKKSPSRRSR